MVGTRAGTATAQADRDRPGGTGWGHVDALDGGPGIAVIAVLLFHGGVSWAKGGFLGVDAFFVLSGLLITSLLLQEGTTSGAIALGHFWSRRARRLLPALLCLVAAAGLYGAFVAGPGALDGLRKDALATLAYVANWRYIAAGANYFEATAAPSILRHTWSLAIEEQFYVVWPLVMLGVFRLARRRSGQLGWTAGIAGAGVVASAIAMAALYQPGRDPSRVYYGTDTRAQVVLTGALLAALIAWVQTRGSFSAASFELDRPGAIALGALAVTGGALFLGAVVGLGGSEPILYRGGFLVISLAVAAVLADIVLVPDGIAARALSFTPLRAVGLVSYGLYLWHWPIYLTLTHDRTHLSGAGLLALRLLATAAVATASYYAVELPIRRGAFPRWRAGVAAPVAITLAVIAALVGTAPPSTPSVTAAAAAAPHDPTARPSPLRPPRPTGSMAEVLVVGDSVAKVLAKRITPTAKRDYGIAIENQATLGCGVVRGGPFRYFGQEQKALPICESWPQRWAEHVERYDPDVVFMIAGRWEVMDRMHDGRWTHLGQAAFDRYVATELDLAIRTLTARNAIVAIATAPYYLRGERPDGGRWPEDAPARVDRFNKILGEVVARYPDRATVLDLNARVSRNGRYTPVIEGINMRFDGVHFSPEGSKYLAPWLLGELLPLAPAGTGPRVRPTTSTTDPFASTTTRPTIARTTSTTDPYATTSTSFFGDDDSTTTTGPPGTIEPDPDPNPRSTTTTTPPSTTTSTSPPTTILPG